MSFSKYYRERVKQLEAENSELRAQIERMQEVSKALALRSAKLDPVEAENAELKVDIFLLLGLVSLVELKSHPAIRKVQEIRERLTVYPTAIEKDGGE